ncbi:hypothetical protein PUS82_00565 [Cytobacillus firmus]|uniref:hypothetical protein n=1 Tax=Cytobacillus firmus TaxID=1399 RepID=UPI00237BC40B|nr:hypothetical protein [Cytobacillus firmus]MDD9309824.1 hypothetical protein [Cytobacillus firmus]
MPRTKVRKIYQEGDRTTFYLKKGFPKEMLDWMNGQSDMQLLFEYALDHLYQNVGPVDIAAILPRTYEIGQGFNAPEGIKAPPVEIRRVPENEANEKPTVEEEVSLPKQEANTEPSFSDEKAISDAPDPIKEKDHNTEEDTVMMPVKKPETAEEKPKEEAVKKNINSWSGLSDMDDSGYY